MGGQVTTLLHRLRVGGGLPAPLTAGDLPGAGPTGPAGPIGATVPEGPAGSDGGVADPGAPPARLVARAVAATGRPQATHALAALWAGLDTTARGAVVDPVGRLGRALRQHDRTTCGSAVLATLAAVGDPVLAAWLATGRLPAAEPRPPELARAPSAVLDRLATASLERRAAALQRVLKRRTNARAVLGVLPWPHALGTPPWGAARVARHAPVRYRAVVLDDTDPAHLARVLDLVAAAVATGVPVPLYTGGDTRAGWDAALPRHVVLAVGAADRRLVLWEPSSGRTHAVARAALLAPRGPSAALGGWTHLVWAVLHVG